KAEDVSYILTDSQSRVVFAVDPEQVAKVLEWAGDLSSLLKVVMMTGQAGDDDRVICWEGLRELGRAWLAEQPDGIEQVIAGISKDMLATLIYTSGTTGRPKGVRLIHDCWLYEGESVDEVDILHPDDLQYLWLPLSHVF